MHQLVRAIFASCLFYLSSIQTSYASTTWIPINVGDVTTIIPLVPNSPYDAPKNIKITSSNNVNTLSWDDVEHASKYDVQALNAQGTWVSIVITEQNSVILDSRFTGYTDIRVVACNYNTCTNTGNWANISVQKDADFIEQIPSIEPVTVASENTSSTEIAELPGKILITDQGAANYSIPFVVPTGRGNFTPKLSLDYSSLSANGVVGLGWSLSTYSTISRCNKNLEEDGSYQEILFNNADALCLGGEKLRLVQGSNLTHGAEYRLQSDSLTKVTQVNSGTQTYFILHELSGNKQVFGNTADSKRYDGQTNQPYLWMLSSKESNFGQTIDYSYTSNSSQERLLSSLTYSGNTVDFVYETRTDQSSHYYLGNLSEKTQRLKRIDVFNHNSDIVRSYHLDYRLSEFSSTSLLTDITLCNNQYRTICSQPTSFDYSDQDLSGLRHSDTILDLNRFTTAHGERNCTEQRMYGYCAIYNMQISDLNNDGRPELIVSTRDGLIGKVLAFEYQNGSFYLNNDLSLFDINLYNYRNYRIGEALSYRFPWQVKENDSTGARDLVLGEQRFYDWDGDGYDEASPRETPNVRLYEDAYTYAYNSWLEFELKAYGGRLRDTPFDYNGDGLIDRLVPFDLESERVTTDPSGFWDTIRRYENTYYLIEINRTQGENYQGDVLYTPNVQQSCSNYDCIPAIDIEDVNGILSRLLDGGADFNGDGNTDYLRGGGIKSGRNFTTITDHNFTFDFAALSAGADINGDGKDDYVYEKNGGIYWRRSLSNSNTNSQLLANHNWGTVNKVFSFDWADLDGDNQPELLYYNHETQKIHIRFDSNTDNKQLDKLTSITTGLSKKYEIKYKRLTDSSVYQADTNAPGLDWGRGSKVRDITSTMSVVAELIESTGFDNNGTVLNEYTRYFYKGLKSQAGGRGSLGFAEVSATTLSNNITTTKYLSQQYPYTGQVYKTEIKHNNQTLIKSSEVTDWWQLPINNSQDYFVAPKTTVMNSYFVNASNGSINSSRLQNIETLTSNYSISSSGYPLMNSSSRQVVDRLDTGTSTKTVSFTYNDEDVSNWLVNRPTQKTVNQSRTGQTSVTQTTEYQYYSGHGSIEYLIKEPSSTNTQLYLKTHYQYDSVGNLTQQTQCSLHYQSSCNQLSVPDTDDDQYKVFRRKNFNFDTQGRYLNSISNPSYIEQAFYQYNKFGLPQEIRITPYDSRQGQRKYSYYDSLGALYFSYSNNGASQQITKQLCSEQITCPANATYSITTTSNSAPDTKVYVDFFGRKVRESAKLLDASWSHTDTTYDVRGRKVAEFKPYKSGDSVYYKNTSYDDLDRKSVVQSISSLGLTTSFSYLNGLVSQNVVGSYSDEANSSVSLDRSRAELLNGFGELIQTTDATGNNATYVYNALGLVDNVTGVDSAIIRQQFDSYGRLSQLNDPDKGIEQYFFNALGESAKKVLADNGEKIDYRNAIGQIIKTTRQRGGEQKHYNFTYNNTPFLQTESTNNASTTYGYDSLHRPFSKTITLDGKIWSNNTYYDGVGRLFRTTDISGNNRGLQYQYVQGTLDRIFELKTGRAYYRATSADAFQNISQYTVGKNIQVSKQYSAITGYLRSINAGNGSIQNQHYRYDQLGNLRYRSNYKGLNNQALIESFSYDELNRLTQVDFNQSHFATQIVDYKDNGSINTKSDVLSGAQYYYGTKPSQCSVTPGVHAVSAIGSQRAYCYDVMGNQTHTYVNGQLTRQVNYSMFAKPVHIKSSTDDSWFDYDAREMKFKRTDTTDNGTKTTYYVDGNEVIFSSDGSSEIKRYINNIAIHTIKSNGAEKLNYIFNDHLGSGSVITSETGLIEHTISFDAFGKRRNSLTWQGYANPYRELPQLKELLKVTQKGFTGHQQVDHAGIIHMGGRIYDPEIGRFLQADPIVQAPKNAQNFNRYSYVLNNPLSYTDPTGYCFVKQGSTYRRCTAEMEKKIAEGTLVGKVHGSLHRGKKYAAERRMARANESANLQNSADAVNGGNGRDSTGFFERIGQRFSNLVTRGQFATDAQASAYDTAAKFAFESGGHERLADFFRVNPPFGGTKAVIEMLSGAGVIRLAQGGKPIILASDETISRWASTYTKNSPNWASGSLKDTLSSLVPNAKAVLSPDGVKTVFSNAKYEVKVDNLFNYFRVRNLSTNQYVDAAGGMVKTGRLSGKEAKNFLQQQTHIRNLDP